MIIPEIFFIRKNRLLSWLRDQFKFSKDFEVSIKEQVDLHFEAAQKVLLPQYIEPLSDLDCTSCGLCTEICPSVCLELEGGRSERIDIYQGDKADALYLHVDDCISCLQCVNICPTQVLSASIVDQSIYKKSEIIDLFSPVE